MPALQHVYDQTRNSGVQFLGIDVRDEQRSAPQDFVRNLGITYPSIYDPPGRSLLALTGYPRSAVPSTIVLDRAHRVAAVFLAALREIDLRPVVARIAAEPPLLYFHGFPGSHVQARAFDHAASAPGVRVVALDRPGKGLSDFAADRRLLDWPADVVEAADALELERFAVVGQSGGGPYAACCAYSIPERLTGVGIVSGLAPFDPHASVNGLSDQQRKQRVGLSKLRRMPVLTRLVAMSMARRSRRRGGGVAVARESMAPVDQARIDRSPELVEGLEANFQQAFRRGSKGFAWDLRLAFAAAWGFELDEITVPVHLWHGGLDKNVPVTDGRYLAMAIPDCRATFSPDEGHLLYLDRASEILTAVAA